MTATMVESAASFAEPEYEVEGTVISKGLPPYDRFEGIPVGTGRVLAERYGG
jgi:hypothetical protein